MRKAGLKKEPLRFAWWGRVSTDDQQDPTLSLPRQLHVCESALPERAVIVAHYFDIESGRKELELRGRGTAHEQFAIPIPRDGGIQELLQAAAEPDRRFDAVICESIERVARRTYFGTKIEHDLEGAGVVLFAADEPIVWNGKRATAILTRRVKQSVAEWYVLELLEKSWDGLGEHSRQGWNVGRPPYGFQAQKIPHPVPARRSDGATKTRLVPDPIRSEVVKKIFEWRVADRLGYEVISQRLNSDLDNCPPPESPDPARRRDYWSRSAVREILRNPKYTGYMVWNRRATKRGGHLNPPEDWVWSSQPTHEALVPLETYKSANELASSRKGSRSKGGMNEKHPDTKRSYTLRSYIFCDLCDKRMSGKVMRSYSYFSCEPRKNLGLKAEQVLGDHPVSVYVREEALEIGVSQFFRDWLFGKSRKEVIAGQLKHQNAGRQDEQRKRIASIKRALANVESKIERQIRALELDDDPDGSMFRRVRIRVAELEHERLALADELTTIDSEEDSELQNPDLIDVLPILDFQVSELPPHLQRALYEAFRLRVHYNKLNHRMRCEVTIDSRDLEKLRHVITHAVCAPKEALKALVTHDPGRFVRLRGSFRLKRGSFRL